MSEHRTLNFYLVAAGDYHDIDFARLELLKLFAEDDKIRVKVAADYHDIESIQASDVLVTYTCNLVPTEEEQIALRDFVASGKRWFALHGTNAILQFLDSGKVDAPETAPVMMETLGTQFLGHPPIQPFTVHISDPDHELVKGIEPFETDDRDLSLPHSRRPAPPAALALHGQRDGFRARGMDRGCAPSGLLHQPGG